MKQYCRYCGFCIEIDSGYYCTDKNVEITESCIKHETKCNDYGYCGIDIITGKEHVVIDRAFLLKKDENKRDLYRQICLFDKREKEMKTND